MIEVEHTRYPKCEQCQFAVRDKFWRKNDPKAWNHAKCSIILMGQNPIRSNKRYHLGWDPEESEQDKMYCSMARSPDPWGKCGPSGKLFRQRPLTQGEIRAARWRALQKHVKSWPVWQKSWWLKKKGG